ncbi:hypothetical protein B0H13DRAFT_2361452 [Mycena leptocephala]|nr:hypothetical protein B0H13DRAFT_2361452 [Mycena leptocephala]
MDREPESAAATHFSRASFSSSEPNEPEPVNNEGSGGVSALTLDISNFQPASGSEGSRVVSVRSDISRYGDHILKRLCLSKWPANRDGTQSPSPARKHQDSDVESGSDGRKIVHWRGRLGNILESTKFHYVIISMVLLDLLVVFIELIIALLNLPCFTEEQKLYFAQHGIVELPLPANCKLQETNASDDAERFLWSLSVTLLSIFIAELIAAGIAFGFVTHFRKPIYMVDAIISSLKSAPSTLIALRLSKIVRAVHAITHSIGLKNQAIIKRVEAAKAVLEASHQQISSMFEQQEWKISYLRAKVTQVTDTELEDYVRQHRLLSMVRDNRTDSESP